MHLASTVAAFSSSLTPVFLASVLDLIVVRVCSDAVRALPSAVHSEQQPELVCWPEQHVQLRHQQPAHSGLHFNLPLWRGIVTCFVLFFNCVQAFLPMVIRYDEAMRGYVEHAIGIQLPQTNVSHLHVRSFVFIVAAGLHLSGITRCFCLQHYSAGCWYVFLCGSG